MKDDHIYIKDAHIYIHICMKTTTYIWMTPTYIWKTPIYIWRPPHIYEGHPHIYERRPHIYERRPHIYERSPYIYERTHTTLLTAFAFHTFTFPPPADAEDEEDADPEAHITVDAILAAFREYCEPKVDAKFERYQFYRRNQEAGESLNDYIIAVTKRSSHEPENSVRGGSRMQTLQAHRTLCSSLPFDDGESGSDRRRRRRRKRGRRRCAIRQLERHRHHKGTARYGNILYVGDGTFDYVSTRYACVRVGNGPVHRVFHLTMED